ncbi:MAG: histidinol dehydrogenase [Nitrospirales bacterium]|nr:histidinol dehydrogenase [Nitrospirales bacterium]
MKIFSHKDPGYSRALQCVVQRGAQPPVTIENTVRTILDAVRRTGDRAVQAYTWKFDRVRIASKQLRVSTREIEHAYKDLPGSDAKALRYATHRIRAFHRRQRRQSWLYRRDGIQLGLQVTPLDAVGLYVPGGKALYPSSVLMNAIPAKVAGVGRVVMCTPTPSGTIHPALLVAADLAGVDEIYRVGGVQAIGAMAYGTPTIRPVDKIVGPGNQYVATAKRLVYGQVDIDMIAGPSELLVVADGSSNPDHVAADLLCEAEHDEEAKVYLVTTSRTLAEQVVARIAKRLEAVGRRKIAATSIGRYACAFVVPSLGQVFEVANRIAAEHLSLNIRDAMHHVPRIRHAGAIFVGRYTPPAVADYVAGPNHVLPTGGSARFFSCLSVDDYIKTSNVVAYSQAALRKARGSVVRLAALEGLDAHGKSMESRWS